MLFNSLVYAQFFAVVFALGWALARYRLLHIFFLLGASFAFYAAWDARFLPLVIGSATVDYFLAKIIENEARPERRKAWLVITVIVNLGILAFFKYADFGIGTATSIANALGFDISPKLLGLTLPVGISFFTFESMSYVIDVYRGDIQATRSYPRYLLFVAFFPKMVAGPIVRPKDILPQLESGPKASEEMGHSGLYLIAMGLIKKIVIADYLSTNLVDRVFDRPFEFSSLETLFAVYGFAAQIYCDFSGYTDIAIGSALLLGYSLPDNFDRPYRALDLREFWRRWHISLSTWLRDYLYISLGGSRSGFFATCRNLMITMLLGGLWHGASWNFVIWGFLHGAALVIGRVWERKRPNRQKGAPTFLGRAWRIFLTFHFVCFAWIFFRAESFAQAIGILRQLGGNSFHSQNLTLTLLLAMAAGIGMQWLPSRLDSLARHRFGRLPAPAQAALLALVALALREAVSAKPVPFIYFQF